MISKNVNENILKIREILPIGKTYDILEKKYLIGGRASCFYFLDGFVKGGVMQRIMDFLYQINPEEMEKYNKGNTGNN